jgi:putative phage-type endonuclease
MFGRCLVDPETLQRVPINTEAKSSDYEPSNHIESPQSSELSVGSQHKESIIDSLSDEFEDFFKESTCCAGTLPDHTLHKFTTFSKNCHEVPVAEPLVFPSSQGMTVRQYYTTYIHRSPEQCVEEFMSPQRSEEWKLARKFSLTASDFGAAAGENAFESPDQLIEKKLKIPFQGNAATQWGSAMEPRASEAFLQFAKHSISSVSTLIDVNLVKYSSSSWMAVSPDNILRYVKNGRVCYDLVEYKCPTRDTGIKHPYAKYPENIPPYYKCQMLGIWGHCNDNGGIYILEGDQIVKYFIGKVWFVVWQPQRLWVTPFEPKLVEWRELHLKLRAWYFEKFLPALYELTQ